MKKLFYSLVFILVLLGGCDYEKLPGEEETMPLDDEVISITGTRLKTFFLQPDTSQIKNTPISVTFTGNVCTFYTSSEYQSGPNSWEMLNSPSTYTPVITYSGFLIDLFYPYDMVAELLTLQTWTASHYTTHVFSSSWNYNTKIEVKKENPIPFSFYDDAFFYYTFEQENFICESYNIPEKGYKTDPNFFEFRSITFPAKTIKEEQAIAIFSPLPDNSSGTMVANKRYLFSDFVSNSFSLTLVCRALSRDFYLYRNISIQFAPSVSVFGWQAHDGNISELIDRFEFDEETNTLTAFFKEYMDNTLGDVFSFFIQKEDGSVESRTISIN